MANSTTRGGPKRFILRFLIAGLLLAVGFLRGPPPKPMSDEKVVPTPTPTPAPTLPRLQMDIMVPAFGIDDKLKKFAARLGKTIKEYEASIDETDPNQPIIYTFRLVATRFTMDEISNSYQLQNELASLSGLRLQQIVMVHSNDQFSRSRAVNLMHKRACRWETCMVTRIDVDMDIKKEFFLNSIKGVFLQNLVTPAPPNDPAPQWQGVKDSADLPSAAYFPIVFSAYNPKSIELVQQELKTDLPEYSEHRGHWRDRGTGMYVLRGDDVRNFQLDEKFEGWGGEDGDFYKTVAQNRRIVRQKEPGLIHVWHGKSCKVGDDGLTEAQLKSCRFARNGEEGSELGKKLLRAKGLFPPQD